LKQEIAHQIGEDAGAIRSGNAAASLKPDLGRDLAHSAASAGLSAAETLRLH